MPERSQVLHESSLNFKIKGSGSKMASISKAGNVETAQQGRGNLHGSGCHIGISFCIHAGTVEHVENYSNYLWVRRTPLPMGLHCQNPLFIGEKSPKGPWAPSPVADLSVLPDGPFAQQGPPPQPFHRKGEATANVVALFSKLMPRDPCLETCALRLVTRDSRLATRTLML